MFNKTAIIVMAFFNAFVWWQIHQIDKDISQKTALVQELNTEVKEAQNTVGLPETVEYVEKIGLVDQLNDQIAELEEQKTNFKLQIKTAGSE